MSFNNIKFTTKGRNLHAKVQAGAALNFTKIVIGDGDNGGADSSAYDNLLNPLHNISITKLKSTSNGTAIVGGVFNNSGLAAFYLREIGLFATDPDLGEILYCYGNAGASAEYIPEGGGSTILERQLNIVATIGNATTLTALIDYSMYSTMEFVQDEVATHDIDGAAHSDIRTLINNLEAEVLQPDYTPVLKRQESVFSVGTGYDSNNVLQDLKSSIIKGQVPINAKGLSAVNLVKNGNFANGTTGWSSSGTIGFTAINGVGEFVGSSNGGFARPSDGKASIGDKVYYCITLKATSPLCNLQAYDGLNINIKYHSGSNTFERLSLIHTQTGTTIDIRAKDNRTSGWDKIYFKNFITINLTAIFGVGNEPDLATCNRIFAKWFDGLQGVNNVVIKGVGKNLFNIKKVQFTSEGYVIDVLTNSLRTYRNASHEIGERFYCQLKPSTSYRISFDAVVGGNITEYYFGITAQSGAGISGSTGVSGHVEKQFTSPSDGLIFFDFARIGGANDKLGWADYKNIQLEENTFSTPYEPYIESISEIPVILHSLPNGIKDEIVDGKFIKRIGEKTFVASDITGLITTPTTHDYAIFTPPSDSLGEMLVEKSKSMLVQGFVPSGLVYSDSASLIGTYCWGTGTLTTNRAVLIVAKGTYASLAAAQAALAGTKIIYQLAIPEMYDLTTHLTVFPNGTISVESDWETTIPELSFAYPLDIVSVIARLNEAVNQNAKLIQDKLDKKRENWITATLQSGWTGTLQYRRNQIGLLEISFTMSSGTITAGTTIATLPDGYRPLRITALPVHQSTDGKVGQFLTVSSSGAIYVPTVGGGIEASKSYHGQLVTE